MSRQAPRPRSPETPKPPETWRLGPRKASEAPVTARQVDFKVLCLPAADHGDEVAAELFVKLVEVQGIEASAASISALKSEMLDRVEEAQPNMVCISATPPAAVIHARYLCKKLHARFPRIPIVVALWDAQGDMKKGSDRWPLGGGERGRRQHRAGGGRDCPAPPVSHPGRPGR